MYYGPQGWVNRFRMGSGMEGKSERDGKADAALPVA